MKGELKRKRGREDEEEEEEETEKREVMQVESMRKVESRESAGEAARRVDTRSKRTTPSREISTNGHSCRYEERDGTMNTSRAQELLARSRIRLGRLVIQVAFRTSETCTASQ